jgi:hypothetical protein
MDFTQGTAQNWCVDPYGVHEARWFSQGNPTALVRDGGIESQDPPPDSAFADRFWSSLPAAPPSAPDVPADGRHRHRRRPALSRRRAR